MRKTRKKASVGDIGGNEDINQMNVLEYFQKGIEKYFEMGYTADGFFWKEILYHLKKKYNIN